MSLVNIPSFCYILVFSRRFKKKREKYNLRQLIELRMGNKFLFKKIIAVSNECAQQILHVHKKGKHLHYFPVIKTLQMNKKQKT